MGSTHAFNENCFLKAVAAFFCAPHRRKLLLCAITALGALAFTGCRAQKAPSARTFISFDTVCTINAYDAGTDALYDACEARLSELEQLFSAHIASSDVCRVNEAAGDHPVKVSGEVFTVLRTAREYAEKSGGAFDPTIGPLVALWGIGTENERIPSDSEIDAARALVNWQHLVLDEEAGTAFLEKAGMALDLGGIAKGFAADEIVRLLREEGVSSALVDLGGNVYVLGGRHSDSGKSGVGNKSSGTAESALLEAWRVGIKNPFHPEDGAGLRVDVMDTSVVTSGNYERYFEKDGRRYHHIIDPKTGWPAESGLVSCTIIDSSSLEADVLTTAVFVLGKEKGLELLKKEGKESVCISFDGTVTVTRDMQTRIKTLSDDLRL